MRTAGGGLGRFFSSPICAVMVIGCQSRPPNPPLLISAVRGRVVDPRRDRAIPGHQVSTGSSEATTDSDGRFVLLDVPPTYDLVIASPDKAYVKVYRGLHRRDPLVTHTGREESSPRSHKARIEGRLFGAVAPGPLHVHFASSLTDADSLVKGPSLPDENGLPYPTLEVQWDGPPVIGGQLSSLQETRTPTGTHSAFDKKTVTLRDGETTTEDLTLAPVPSIRLPAGRVTVDDESERAPVVRVTYRVAGSGLAFAGMGPPRAGQAAEGTDPKAIGATLCMESFVTNPWIRSRHLLCGVPVDKPVNLHLRAGPTFSAPPSGTGAEVGMTFAWSTTAGAVYRLALTPTHPSPAAPYIETFTASPTAVWPDLHDRGVAFPKPLLAYGARVSALGPYPTIDAATGPEGLGATVQDEAWSTSSSEISVPVQPPIGKEEAACQYEYGSAIVCGPASNPQSEFYMLAAINNKLRHYPAFANAVGIHCVRDCAAARAFIKAYGAYAASNPGFDADEPREPTPPPPRPPALPDDPAR